MHRAMPVAAMLVFLAALGCKPALTPAQQAALDRSECQAQATQQSGFDPLTAQEPPRTISTTERRGGEVVGSGSVVKGAAQGAVLGVVGGAIMGKPGAGAGAGAAIGGLMGGYKRHQETNQMVTRTHTNPEWEDYEHSKDAFRTAFDQCLAARAAGGAQ